MLRDALGLARTEQDQHATKSQQHADDLSPAWPNLEDRHAHENCQQRHPSDHHAKKRAVRVLGDQVGLNHIRQPHAYGREKHDAGPAYPSFAGWFDELRLSTTLRYSANFVPQTSPFVTDSMTAALYHFDEGSGTVAGDSSGAPGGPSNGELKVGGSPVGPLWSSDTPFTQTSGPFNDIAGSTFETEILWLFDQGITTGCTATSYCPDDQVTRAQMATFLARALALDPVSSDSFSDDDGSVHESNIEALAGSGITLGCADGLFCPDDSVSRAQMASFLVRGIDGLDPATQDYFADDDGNVHEANINVVAENGITLGCGEAVYCPTDSVTRGQMAAFLFRALN